MAEKCFSAFHKIEANHSLGCFVCHSVDLSILIINYTNYIVLIQSTHFPSYGELRSFKFARSG